MGCRIGGALETCYVFVCGTNSFLKLPFEAVDLCHQRTTTCCYKVHVSLHALADMAGDGWYLDLAGRGRNS